jgi:uncharacterized protein (TIGR03084 family)
MTPFEALLADLADEQAALDAVLARMPEPAWDLPTHAPGWLVRDQVTHLAHVDEAAARSMADPDAFRAEVAALAAARARDAYEQRYLARGRAMRPAALLEWYRAAGAALRAAARTVSPKARLPWYGPDMSALSSLTARLMETWSHGLDVVDVVGIERPDTDRLRHVAFLGVLTRSFSYANRGLAPNTAPVLVRLVAPSGATWTFGDEGAADRIEGTATDFCRVVTQRRHLADTRLRVTGPNAAEWVAIAQAFAGPPGRGRAPGEFPIEPAPGR